MGIKASGNYIRQVAVTCRCGISVTDLINRIVQILKQDLRQVKISVQEAGLMEPVKP